MIVFDREFFPGRGGRGVAHVSRPERWRGAQDRDAAAVRLDRAGLPFAVDGWRDAIEWRGTQRPSTFCASDGRYMVARLADFRPFIV